MTNSSESRPKAKMPAVIIHFANKFDRITPDRQRLIKLVEAVCNHFGASNAAVDIAIVDDARIRELNKQFLDKDENTDCLSFDLSENQTDKAFEVVVNGQMAVRQATARGHSALSELALYITHGLLHNLGFDDSTKAAAQKMHTAEDRILQEQGFGVVYNSKKRKSNSANES